MENEEEIEILVEREGLADIEIIRLHEEVLNAQDRSLGLLPGTPD
jgi:hypothetical protein